MKSFVFGLLLAACAIGPSSALAATAPVKVAIVTTAGTIVVSVDTEHAPVTAGNFLKHVDAGVYDSGSSFYRAANASGLSIIQGGIEPRSDTMPPIAVEKTSKTGLHNVAGTIAMARTGDPNSATTEFFINTGDDRRLDADRFSDGFGYAVFGTIASGMDVVTKIQESPENGDRLLPPIKILSIKRVS